LIRPAGPWLAVVLLAAACAGGGTDGGNGGGPKGCACEPPDCPTVSFNNNIQPIFNRSCATSSVCHGPNGAEGLVLVSGSSIGNTVGVRANQLSNGQRILRIKPGAPQDSYLFLKMTADGPPAISGTPMPQGTCPGAPIGGAVCPTDDEINAISQWISECATNTPSLP
jgi:hypothetical protein